MQPTRFNKTRLATCLSITLGMGAMSPAFAEESEVEVIEVTGMRGSLIKSMDMKRDGAGVVDAINAEDIGKFPDTNLAESLQRITGVSIDRSNGEGSKVSVRGFGPEFNLVTLNGRQLPNTTGNRSFDFANIAAEGVSGVEVYKTSLASLGTGGIGSTINITTHKPLNSPGVKASFGVKAVTDSSSRDANVTPEISALYSRTFADDKFGISANFSYQDRESGNAQANVGTGWRTFTHDQDNTNSWGGITQNPDHHINRPGEGQIYGVPQTTIYKFEEQQRKRMNGQLVLQYQPTDSIRATLDYYVMQNDIDRQHHDISAWYNFLNDDVNGARGVWTDGAVSSPLVYWEGQPGQPDVSMAAGMSAERRESQQLGFNIEWQVNDDLSLSLDAHKSTAEYGPNGPHGTAANLSMAGMVRAFSATDFTGDRPILSVGFTKPLEPSDMIVTGSVFGNAHNKMDITQAQFDGNYLLNDTMSIDFGLASTEVENLQQSVNVQRNDWGGVSQPGDMDDAWFPTSSIQDKFDTSGGDFSIADQHPQLDKDTLQANILDYMFLWDFEKVRARAAEMYPSDAGGDCGNGYCPSSDFSKGDDRLTNEKSMAAYFQYNLETDIADMPFSAHVGLRYEKTEVTSTSNTQQYSDIRWVGDTELEQIDPQLTYQTQTGEYDYWLPNVNLNLEVMEDMLVRAAYSHTLGRPNYVAIQGGTSVPTLGNVSNFGGSSGNPALLPLESKNIDLAWEWYYAEGSYVNVGYFRKDTVNAISNGKLTRNFDGLNNPFEGPKADAARAAGATNNNEIRQYIFDNYADDPNVDVANGHIYAAAEDAPMDYIVDVPVNEGEFVIDGLEAGVQHFFGDTGFGVIANYTKVNSESEYNPAVQGDQPAIVGISDTANFIAVYDNHGVQARLAYNWRDKFLTGKGQDTGEASPQFVEAYGQVDFNVGYELPWVKGLNVVVEGINITNEPIRVHGRSESQVLSLVESGARYMVGARYSF
ncbi:TonB-dependent receptor [Paraferrimonas sp. SM1919]|uniref:TonB-dependent receptor n=1 Tax=Paraferrimonas sp. SM1919 TaxID=2662263 RepID=UPI0013D267B1|nr:TonB-dependent receptor [Paraferrimonas sp. SM1919]